MPWFKIDDNLHAHPKARRAGLEAIGLWSIAGSHCMDYWSEGFVPEWFVLSWPNGKKLASRLVAARLWQPGEKDGEQGWMFHDWHARQPSREQYEAKKDATQKRVADWRARRNLPSDTTGNGTGNAVTGGVSKPVTNTIRTGPGTGSTSSVVSSTSVSKPRKRGTTIKTDIPKGWKPNEKHLKLAQELGVNTAGLVEQFMEWHGARGNKFANWDLAFSSWIRKARDFDGGGNSGRHLQAVGPSREAQVAWEEAQRVAPDPSSLPW